MILPVRTVDSFKFYILPFQQGFRVIQIGEGILKVLKKGRIFLAKEFALDFLDKYIKQGTYKI